MAVLALDTATNVAAVAVGSETDLIASAVSHVPRGHSRVLQPMVQHVLQTAGLSARDVGQLVIGVGPGSYTGVRLGVATAKAMASALSVPLKPVSTLWALAAAAVPHGCANDTLVLPLLFARRQRAFGALYRKRGDTWHVLLQDEVRTVETWMTQAEAARETAMHLVVVHDFEPRHQMEPLLMRPYVDSTVRLTQVSGNLPAGLLTVGRISENELTGSDVHRLVPDYALPVEAEAKLAERRAKRDGSA